MIKNLLITLALSIVVVFAVQLAVPTNTVVAQTSVVTEQLCNNSSGLDDKSCNGSSDGLFSEDGLFGDILNILSLAIGAVAVIVIVVAGFRFVVSSGDPQAVASARNQILYAIIGIVVAIFAQTIVRFVLAST